MSSLTQWWTVSPYTTSQNNSFLSPFRYHKYLIMAIRKKSTNNITGEYHVCDTYKNQKQGKKITRLILSYLIYPYLYKLKIGRLQSLGKIQPKYDRKSWAEIHNILYVSFHGSFHSSVALHAIATEWSLQAQNLKYLTFTKKKMQTAVSKAENNG